MILYNKNIQNSFNTIRLLAALQVLYGHTIEHLNLTPFPVWDEFINFFAGVPIFFTLSGFFIWDSIKRSHSFKIYIKKRFYRIYPELWVAVFVELVILLLLYHKPIIWKQIGVFAITQSTIFQFWTPEYLRGYGCGCPNGSLWTICVLIQFYIVVYFIYKLLHKQKLKFWIIGISLTITIGLLTQEIQNLLPEIGQKLYKVSLFPYLWMFLIATFIAEWKQQLLPNITKYWWIPTCLVIFFNTTQIDFNASYPLLHSITLFLCVIGIGYRFTNINIHTDISYGIYIYHMTIVNALLTLGYTQHPVLLLIVSLISCLFAWISTQTVGKVSQKMKRKIK